MCRQNGKSTLIAALQICHLIFDQNRFHNQVHGVFYSNKWDQAYDLFKKAKDMIEDCKLTDKLGLITYKNYITDVSRRNQIKPIPSNSQTVDGMRITMLAGDEIATSQSSNLSLVLKSGIIQNKNTLEFLITTASINRNTSYGFTIYNDYKKQLLAGTVPDHCLPMIFEPNEKDKPGDLIAWKRANPLLTAGVFKSHEFRQAYIDSKKSFDEAVNFKTKILNQYDSSSDRFVSDADIDRAMLKEPYEFDKNEQVFIGIDDTLKKDLGAITLLQRKGRIFYVDTIFFSTIQRINHMTKHVRSPFYINGVKEGKLIPMGDTVKDGEKLVAYLQKQYIDVYDMSIEKATYDNTSFSAGLFNDLKERFEDLFCTDTTIAKTKMATSMVWSLFVSGKIKINPNSLMRYSLSCGYYKTSGAGNMQLERKDITREDDGLKSLVYAFSGAFNSRLDFFLEEFGNVEQQTNE